MEPTGAPRSLAEAHRHAVEALGDARHALATGHRGVPQPGAVEVALQAPRSGQLGGCIQVGDGQHLAVPGVLQGQQAGAREVGIVRFDGRGDVGQQQRAVGLLRERLRLDAAEHRGATGLVTVVVGQLADDHLVAALAVRQQRTQVALRAAGDEKPRFLAEQSGHARLQGIDRRVVAEDVIAHLGPRHGLAHGGRGPGDGIAAQIDHVHWDALRASRCGIRAWERPGALMRWP